MSKIVQKMYKYFNLAILKEKRKICVICGERMKGYFTTTYHDKTIKLCKECLSLTPIQNPQQWEIEQLFLYIKRVLVIKHADILLAKKWTYQEKKELDFSLKTVIERAEQQREKFKRRLVYGFINRSAAEQFLGIVI
jgi:hypothetical protein